MRKRIDYEALNEEALPDAQEIIEHFFPDLESKVEGNELVMLNPRRVDWEFGSFKFNLETGLWADFAEVDDAAKGGGVVGLLAYLLDRHFHDVALMVQAWLQDEEPPPTAAGGTQTTDTAQMEVPSEQSQPVMEPAQAPTQVNSSGTVFSDAELRVLRQMASTRDSVYIYCNASGEAVQVVVRRDFGGGRKTFRQYSKWPDREGSFRVVMKAHPVPRPLYGLELATPGATLVLVEGEKSADAARQLLPGYTVLTHSGGANGVKKADWTSVPGFTARVVIWPDFDEAGLKCMSDTAGELKKVGPKLEIKLLNLPAFFSALCERLGQTFDADEWHAKDAADVLELGVDGAVVPQMLEQHLMEVPEASTRVGMASTPVEEGTPSADGLHMEIGGIHYCFREKYVAQVKWSKDDGPYEVSICSGIRMLGSARDAGSADWSLILEIRQPDGGYRPFVMQASRTSSPQDLMAELMSMGLKLYAKQEALLALLKAAEPSPHYLLVRESGWCANREYVLGSTKVTSVTEEPIYSVAPDRTEYEVSGTVAEWNEHVGRYCRQNSRLLLFLGATLAAPLLRLLHMGSAGFHLVGPSSVGKTTAMKVAASMVGFPADMILMWRTTSNALEVIAAGRNDGVLLLDELAMCPADEVDGVAYMLGNGMGKQRMGRSGALREVKRWCVMALSTGEITPEQHLASAGKRWRAGMEMRLASLLAAPEGGHGLFEQLHDKATGVELSTHLGHATARYYGAVFRAWVEFIATSAADAEFMVQLERRVEATKAVLYQGNEGQIHRAAKVFALIQVALEMAIGAGILSLPDGDPRWGVEVCFQAWMQMRGGDTAAEEIAILRQVSGTLQRTAQSHFTRLVPGLGNTPEVRDFRHEAYGYSMPTSGDGGDQFAIFPAVFDQEFCQGYAPKQVKDLLRQHGYLVPGADDGPTVMKRLPLSTSDPRRYVVIWANIMEAYPVNL